MVGLSVSCIKMSTARLSLYRVLFHSLNMWALFVFVLVSSAIASPASRVPGNDEGLSELPRIIKDRCDRNGDTSTLNNYIEAKNTFLVNINRYTQRFRYEHIDQAEMFCRMINVHKTGVVNVAAALRPCVRADNRQILDRVPEMVDSLFKHVCFNERQAFISLLKPKEECVMQHASKIRECLVNFFDGILKPSEPFNKEREEQESTNGCQPLLDYKTCLKNEMDQCPNSSFFTSFTGLIDSVMKPVCQ